MIITLSGKISHKSEAWIVVECAGVGYQVMMAKTMIMALKLGEAVRLWIHDHIREDARDLYGFNSEAEFRLFEKMLTISGIGPKVAMAIVSIGDTRSIQRAVETGDVAVLSSIPGVGKKTAQKIVLELQGKLVLTDDPDAEVFEALVGMGHARERVREVMAEVRDIETVEEKIKLALKKLGKR